MPIGSTSSSPSSSTFTLLPNAAQEAAEQIDGGCRSFTLANQPNILSRHTYHAPNERYQRLFWSASSPTGTDAARSPYRSAGWLVPEDPNQCKPVLVAHSTLSAIWLLRALFPPDTLDDNAWDALVQAAQHLKVAVPPRPVRASAALGEDALPPSAQRASVPSPPPKRTAPTAGFPPSKRPRSADVVPSSSQGDDHEEDVEDDEHDEHDEVDEVDEAAKENGPERDKVGVNAQNHGDHDHDGTLRMVATVTNNNRRAEQRRTVQRNQWALQQKQSLGLVQPHPSAPLAERNAYQSIAPCDEPTVAWVIKQRVTDDGTDFYAATRTPYLTSTTMLQKARVLGNQTALHDARAFIEGWRKCNTPFPTQALPTAPAGLIQHTVLSQPRDANSSQPAALDHDLCVAWNMVTACENVHARICIQYRWAMAVLGYTYADRIALLERDDAAVRKGAGRSRGGKGKLRTEAINALLPRIQTAAPATTRDAARKRLLRASRWYEAAKELGWGFLCLIPSDAVANYWVEQTLRSGEFRVWLQLVKRVNPDVYAASQNFNAWLGSESMPRASIEGKRQLVIETAPSVTRAAVEEVADSETSDSEGLDGEEEDALRGPAPAGPLRQLTLLELFEPRQ